MDKKELAQIMAEYTFGSVEDTDLLFGRSAAAGRFGFFPATALSGNTYACRRWDLETSSPVGEVYGNVDYIRQLPSLLGLGCYLVDDAHNRKKLDPADHYRFASGGTAQLDGSAGQYMWGTRVPFYIAIWTEGHYIYKAASLKPIPGRACWRIPIFSKSAFNAGVMDRTENKLCSIINTAERYRGGNNTVLTGNAHADNLSQLGYPATEIGTSTFQLRGAARGAGWGAGWYWIETVTGILFEIIMGTRHCQTAYNANKDANGLYQGGLGAGVSAMPGWEAYNGYHPVIPTSAGLSLADGVGVSNFAVLNDSGTTVYNAPVPVFFGLKNPYGHLWVGKNLIVAKKLSDGSYAFYVARSSRETWDYSATNDMLYVGDLAAPASAGWDYIKSINYNGLAGMPAEGGATSSTYHADGMYRDVATSGFRSPLGSGYAHHGDTVGLACFSGSSAPTLAHAYLSSPLCETPDDFDPSPVVYS